MKKSDSEANKAISEIAVELRREPIRQTEFVVMVESISADGSTAKIKLCTGGTLHVPTSLAASVRSLGHVRSGNERYALTSAEIDVTNDAGKVLQEAAYEIARLSQRVRITSEESRRLKIPGASSEVGSIHLPQTTVNLQPSDYSLPVTFVKMSFFALAGNLHQIDYVSPPLQYIYYWRLVGLGNCYLIQPPQVYAWYVDPSGIKHPAGINFYLEAAHGTPLGTRYFGSIELEVGLVIETT
jgi:hypothetical protein